MPSRKNVPWLIGGAADLYPSTKTLIKDGGDFEKGNYSGRNFHFGIREHTMGVDHQRHGVVATCGRMARRSSFSPTTCARRFAWLP